MAPAVANRLIYHHVVNFVCCIVCLHASHTYWLQTTKIPNATPMVKNGCAKMQLQHMVHGGFIMVRAALHFVCCCYAGASCCKKYVYLAHAAHNLVNCNVCALVCKFLNHIVVVIGVNHGANLYRFFTLPNKM